MRDVVQLSLGLNSAFTLLSCGSGEETLVKAADWTPDLILCDFMMPDMEGPAVLARLRENPVTAKIPVVFMTARVQPSEVERLKALGAVAVLSKPFDPATLADTVRRLLQSLKLASAGYDFAERLRNDTAALTTFRQTLRDHADISLVPDGLESCVHKLAGAAGVFNLQAVSQSASALEEAIIARRAGRGAPGAIEANLDALLDCIERE